MCEALRHWGELFLQKGALKVGLRIPGTPSRHPKREDMHSSGVDLSQDIREANLEDAIAGRLVEIERGLQLVGRQRTLPGLGRVDILCKDRNGNLVVIEIKKFGASTDAVMSQISAYMGYVKEHLASRGQRVRGIIVAGEPDARLKYAVKTNPDIEIRTFSVRLEQLP